MGWFGLVKVLTIGLCIYYVFLDMDLNVYDLHV